MFDRIRSRLNLSSYYAIPQLSRIVPLSQRGRYTYGRQGAREIARRAALVQRTNPYCGPALVPDLLWANKRGERFTFNSHGAIVPFYR